MSREYRLDFPNWAEVFERFEAPCPKREPKHVFAIYSCDGCDGSALVIVWTCGKLLVVEGAHCSCFGLDGQWLPTEHGKRDIRKFLTANSGLFERFRDDIEKWLKELP